MSSHKEKELIFDGWLHT